MIKVSISGQSLTRDNIYFCSCFYEQFWYRVNWLNLSFFVWHCRRRGRMRGVLALVCCTIMSKLIVYEFINCPPMMNFKILLLSYLILLFSSLLMNDKESCVLCFVKLFCVGQFVCTLQYWLRSSNLFSAECEKSCGKAVKNDLILCQSRILWFQDFRFAFFSFWKNVQLWSLANEVKIRNISYKAFLMILQNMNSGFDCLMCL